MTREEAAIIVGNIPIDGSDQCYSIPEYQEAKTMAIEALTAQPCGDAVSRKAVLDIVDGYGTSCHGNDSYENVVNGLVRATKAAMHNAIEKIPSVTPERPKGGFTRQELENWLYSICLNNVGTDFCKDTEEIISRLDGFEQYVKDMRGSEKNDRHTRV